ncbi:phage terminase small subunit [Sphingomonas oligophenolica]|nr:phage terminase small subunit [Sphingomonas oligophenolica]
MTPAREHRMGHAIAAMATTGTTTDADALAAGVDPVAAQIRLRLAHDLRRLKDIQSIERKIEAKREMLPAYMPWVSALLESAQEAGQAVADEVLPTIMVWAIDTSDWFVALNLAGYVLHFDVPLPSRYQRAAPTLIVEEVADQAARVQAKDEAFPLEVLQAVDALTDEADMHDEVRAKLMKTIGIELARAADQAEGSEAVIATGEIALAKLRRAQELNPRAGAKDRIKRLEKAVTAARTAGDEATAPAA